MRTPDGKITLNGLHGTITITKEREGGTARRKKTGRELEEPLFWL